MTFWTMYDFEGELLIEGEIEEVIKFLPKIGENVELLIYSTDRKIILKKINYEFDRALQIRQTRNRSLKSIKQASAGYVDHPHYKFCYACDRSKPLGEFGFRSNAPDGLATNCRECVAKKAKKRRKRKKKELSEQ